jgi:hypothetical protein
MFDIIQNRVDQDFRLARRTALHMAVRGRLRRAPTTLLPLQDVSSRILIRGQRDLGIRTVPIDNIVGSEGRAYDFDRHFLPRTETTQARWKRIDLAYYQEVSLPPVDLYKLGEIYFVRDGNHRVSVARHRGQTEIDARVVEFQTDIPLTPDLDEAALIGKEAQSKFIQRTNILRLRPGIVVPQTASDPEAYQELLRHIDGHRYFMGLDRDKAITLDQAIVHWYDAVYLPQIEAIRNTGIAGAFGGHTESTLYLRIMDHRHYVTEQAGRDLGPDAAAIDYALRFGPWRARRKVRKGNLSRVKQEAPRLRDNPADKTEMCGNAKPSWLLNLWQSTQRLFDGALWAR